MLGLTRCLRAGRAAASSAPPWRQLSDWKGRVEGEARNAGTGGSAAMRGRVPLPFVADAAKALGSAEHRIHHNLRLMEEHAHTAQSWPIGSAEREEAVATYNALRAAAINARMDLIIQRESAGFGADYKYVMSMFPIPRPFQESEQPREDEDAQSRSRREEKEQRKGGAKAEYYSYGYDEKPDNQPRWGHRPEGANTYTERQRRRKERQRREQSQERSSRQKRNDRASAKARDEQARIKEMFKRMERERHRRREERAQEEAKGWGRRLPPKPPPSTLLLEHTRALGIKDGTKLSKKLVKSSFQQKAKTWHPDTLPHDSPQRPVYEEKFKAINSSYRELLSRCHS